MNKRELKSLLENIYVLLAENAPVPTIDKPATVTPELPPSQPELSYYDVNHVPTLPDAPYPAVPNGWQPGAHVVWPPPAPGTYPFPAAGPGGTWIMNGPGNPPGQSGNNLHYVYPPGPNGLVVNYVLYMGPGHNPGGGPWIRLQDGLPS